MATCAVPSSPLRRGHPAPVDRLAECLAHLGLVERRLGRVEPVVLGRQRRDRPELRAERLVVAEPGGVDARDGRVVEGARRERIDRPLTGEVGDQVDGLDGRRARPVVRVGRQLECRVGLAGRNVSATRHEARPGRQGRPACIDPGRDDRERRTGHDVDEVGRRMDEIDREVATRVIGVEPDRGRVGRRAVEVCVGTLDVEDQGRQGRGVRRVDQPQPAADDVGCPERAPVGEGQARSEMERHLLTAVGELPGFRQSGADLEVRVEARQRLEQLCRDGRAAGVALGRRVERRGLPGQDPDRLVRARTGRSCAGDEQRRERKEGEESAHRAEYRAGRPRAPATAPDMKTRPRRPTPPGERWDRDREASAGITRFSRNR